MRLEDFQTLYQIEDNHWWFVGMREITGVMLDSEVKNLSNPRVLDAGCGTGIMLGWLKRYSNGEDIYGIDSSQAALGFSRFRGHKKLVQGDISNLPFVSNSFTLITCFDVLQQVTFDNELKTLSELYRVLAPGGLLYIRVAANQWLWSGHDRALGTQHRYDLYELQEKLLRIGFTISRSTYVNALLFSVAVIIRLYKKIIFCSTSDVRPMPRGLTWLNRLLTSILKIEAWYLKNPRRRFPFGLSAVCLAHKKLC